MRKLFYILLLLSGQAVAQQAPKVGTTAIAGIKDGVVIHTTVQGPGSEKTPLQIACVFEYTPNDIIDPPALPAALNGMQHLDKALNGLITSLRASGQFSGQAFETLLISPAPGLIKAKHLLLIGLGKREQFNAAIMYTVGSIGMREALKLGVESYAHASDLKDAGVDSPTGLVAGNIVKGALSAIQTQKYLAAHHAGQHPSVKAFTLLTGPAFYQTTLQAIKTTLDTLHQ